jgi:uncharacterized protein (DUF58 family)
VNDAATVAAPTLLDRRRVYIFPTRAGLAFGLMIFLILLGAMNYDNALGYQLAFLLSGLLVVAMLHTYRNLAGLSFLRAQGHATFAGREAVFHCFVHNPTQRRRMALNLSCWPRGLSRQERRYWRQFETRFDLGPEAADGIPIRVEAHRRGWLTLDRLVIHTEYPLGLLHAWAYFDCAASALVYPEPRGDLPLPRGASDRIGVRAQAASGVDEFMGLRPYRAGDPLRAVAWRSLAREQELSVKQFHGQRSEEIRLSWAATSAHAHKERRLSQLCRWVLMAERAGLRYALELPELELPAGQGSTHRDSCLRALALFEAEP